MAAETGRRQRLAATLESFSDRIGKLAAWLTLPLVLGTFIVVVLRYVFVVGWIWLQEITVYLHALVFLLAAAYTLGQDEHVRVDVFFRGWSTRRRNLVNAWGTVLLLLPTVAAVLWFGWGYVARSWLTHEQSRETGGLPYPWPPVLKTALLLAFVLLALRGIALLLRGGELRPDEVEKPRVSGP